MKVRVGDKVKVIAGKDLGKEGTITKIIKKKDRVVVSGVNIVKRAMKPNAQNEAGGIVSMEAPIHVSNVKVVTEKKAAKAAKTEEVKTVKTEEKKTTKKAETKKTTKKAGDK
jgi:large subunit ribosomal protein L24